MVDEQVERLATLFREQPAWRAAAAVVDDAATSDVYFSQRPDGVWHLEQRNGETSLLPGASNDPDFVFRFSPEAIDTLEATRGGISEVAVALFSLMLEDAVQLRIVAGFQRLVGRGYVKLLLAGGFPVLGFGARHGVRSVAALRRLVAQLRASGPRDWET